MMKIRKFLTENIIGLIAGPALGALVAILTGYPWWILVPGFLAAYFVIVIPVEFLVKLADKARVRKILELEPDEDEALQLAAAKRIRIVTDPQELFPKKIREKSEASTKEK